ncbi:MAG: polyprenyl synthetase family protein [Bacteroidia bacterium]|nr:polyprenyl synthetase family protein [Bacteroidia bacterium]
MKSNVALLDTIMTYIVKRKGKQVRPMFVFYCAKLFGGVTDATYRGASLVELLHTATLVHDDVVDDSDERRGFFSINALWKNKIAVLVGDYLLSKGLLLAIRNKDFKLLEIVSTAVEQMSEGELLQIEKARNLNLSEEIYYDIIRKKTASLIASCCAMGAASAGANEEQIEQMRLFGECIGIAFQIKDDLLDYGDDDIGKPTGIDLKEKKLTLPIIYTINHADKTTRNFIINSIKNHNTEKKRVAEVIKYVNEHDGINYTRKAMVEYKQKALAILAQQSNREIADKLAMLVEYIIDRKN